MATLIPQSEPHLASTQSEMKGFCFDRWLTGGADYELIITSREIPFMFYNLTNNKNHYGCLTVVHSRCYALWMVISICRKVIMLVHEMQSSMQSQPKINWIARWM